MTQPQTPPAVPLPRGDREAHVSSSRVFGAGDWVAYVLLTALNLAALGALLAFWSSIDLWNEPVSLLVVAVVATALVLWWARWIGLPVMRRPVPMQAVPGLRVGVATTFVPGAESFEMLEETVRALVGMSYPHDTWVLDEGDDSSVRRLCAELGARHFTRRHVAGYNTDSGRFARATKYGNYNAWLDEVGLDRYDIVVAFDPDHVPLPAFLERVLGFFRDPQVAYVQAAQVYYNQQASFIARGAAEETYAYYSSLQMASYALGYPIVTGCHNAHRATALREIGGLPPHEADDLLMTLEYRSAGYEGVYVPEVLAEGITPVDWAGYLGQQRRWARSVLDVKLRYLPGFWRRLGYRERLAGLVHGLHYLYPLTTVLGVALLAFVLVSGDRIPIFGLGGSARLGAVVLAVMAGDAYRQRFFIDRPREWGVHWRSSFLRYAKWPALLAGLWDAVRGTRGPYLLTLKVRSESTGLRYLLPHAAVAALLVVCGAVGWMRGADMRIGAVIFAAVTVVVSSLVVASVWRGFPAPYSERLRERRRKELSATIADAPSRA